MAQGAVGRVGEGEGPDLGHGDQLLGGHGHRKSERGFEQKTYDKNNMLMRKAKDIRAKFARM